MKSDLYTKPFIIMGIANFFTVSSFGCFFLFPLFIESHGGTKSDIGIIMGIFALASVMSRPFVSEMIDRVGRKKSYAIGCLTMTLASISYLFFNGHITTFYPYLLLSRFIHGVGLGICFTATFTYVADIIPKNRLNEGLGMFGMTGLIGLAVGPAIGEWVIRNSGFPHFFVTATLMALTGLAFQVFLPETYVADREFDSKEFASNSVKSVSDTNQMDFTDYDPSSETFFSLLKRRKIFSIAILATSFGFAMASTGSFVAPFANEQGIRFISLYYIVYSISAVLTRFFGGRIADGIGEQVIIPYAAIMTGTGLGILVFLGGSWVLVAAGGLSGCGHGFLFPCMNSLIIRDEPVFVRGKITGIFTGAIDAGAFLGSVVLGYIGEMAGYRTLFFVSMMIMFSGLAYFMKAYRPNDDKLTGG